MGQMGGVRLGEAGRLQGRAAIMFPIILEVAQPATHLFLVRIHVVFHLHVCVPVLGRRLPSGAVAGGNWLGHVSRLRRHGAAGGWRPSAGWMPWVVKRRRTKLGICRRLTADTCANNATIAVLTAINRFVGHPPRIPFPKLGATGRAGRSRRRATVACFCKVFWPWASLQARLWS